MAYNFGFKLAADAGNATFVVVLDADELAVPFADGCLGPLVRLCRNLERCGGLSLNWRITRAATDATAARPDATLLQAAGIDGTAATVGLLHPFVKTIARVAAHTPGSFEVHNNRPRPPYALLGEDLRPIRSGSARMWTRSPPSGERAFVLHLHCIRLIDWVCPADSFISVPGTPDHPRAETCCPCGQVFRRSMRGDVLKGGIASCPTCGASLLEIEREFRDTCTNAATSRGQRVETPPPSVAFPRLSEAALNHPSVRAFTPRPASRVQAGTHADGHARTMAPANQRSGPPAGYGRGAGGRSAGDGGVSEAHGCACARGARTRWWQWELGGARQRPPCKNQVGRIKGT